MREIVALNTIIRIEGLSGNATKDFPAVEIVEIHRRAVLKDIDFWMF